MSQHPRDTEKQVIEEKTLPRSSSAASAHSKPSSVINQLKTKVKRKRTSNLTSLDLSDSGSNVSINNNGTTKRASPEQVELARPRPRIANDLQSPTLATIFSYDGTEPDRNSDDEIKIEEEKQDLFFATSVTDEHDVEENMSWQTKSITTDSNQKISRPKLKVIKAAKSLPETNQPLPPAKKRRQTIRRTGFQIRDEDFSLIFSNLPADEQLVIGYPAAWRKDVFMHGRLFLSVHYLCFYTCFFKWEESLCIAFKDIVSVTREKSVILLPNAIRVRTKNHERYFFASTLPRERIFITIFRLWQNALLEEPLDYHQLRAVVFADQQSLDESSEESEESVSLETPAVETGRSDLHSLSLPIIHDRLTDHPARQMKISRRVVSLPPDNEHASYLYSCTCESHLAKTYADRLFTFSVETLFELLFSDNSFTRSLHDAQKLTDYNYGEWRLNRETGHRERQVNYKTITQSILGTNALSCRERQILEVEKSNLIYVVSSEVYNEGMKYTDTFYVATRFCMTQRDAEHSALRATAEVRYTKNVNSFIKTIIEKNAYASIEEGINEQVRRLENHQANKKINQKIGTVSRRSRTESENNERISSKIQANSLASADSNVSIKNKTITGKGIFYDTALFIGICLLFLHIYLCYKLHSFDGIISTPDAMCVNQCIQTCQNNGVH